MPILEPDFETYFSILRWSNGIEGILGKAPRFSKIHPKDEPMGCSR
jgi:hypothetical protein